MKTLVLGVLAGLLIATLVGYGTVTFADHPPKPPPEGTEMSLRQVNPPPAPPSPVSSVWHEEAPNFSHLWHITSWLDRGDPGFGPGDIIDMRRVNHHNPQGKDFGPTVWASVLQLDAPCTKIVCMTAVVIQKPGH